MTTIRARPKHWFSWGFDLDLDGPVQVFLFWLVVLLWRRAANNAAAAGSQDVQCPRHSLSNSARS